MRTAVRTVQSSAEMRACLPAVIVLSLLARAAHAEVPSRTPAHKSPNAAFGLSFAGTLVTLVAIPVGVFAPPAEAKAGGLAVALLAPSAGTLYAGDVLTPGLALRGLGVAVIAGIVQRDSWCEINQHDQCHTSDLEIHVIEAAAAAIVVGGVWDSIRGPSTVRAHNARVDLTLAPVVTPTSSGLAITGSF